MHTIENKFFASFLNPDEQIRYIVHKHWWAVVKPLTKSVLLGIILPLGIFWLFIETWWSPLVLIALVGGVVMVVHTFYDWYYDVMLITTESIVDIDWRGFFKKTSTRINYEDIATAQYKSHGFISTMLKFGDLTLDLRNSDSISLPYTANAKKMQQWILDQRDMFSTSDSEPEVEALKKAITSLLGDEMVKRQHGIVTEDTDEEDLPDDADEAEEDFDDQEPDEELREGEIPVEILHSKTTAIPQDEEMMPEQQVIIMETRSISPSKREKAKHSGFTSRKVKDTKPSKARTKKKSKPKKSK